MTTLTVFSQLMKTYIQGSIACLVFIVLLVASPAVAQSGSFTPYPNPVKKDEGRFTAKLGSGQDEQISRLSNGLIKSLDVEIQWWTLIGQAVEIYGLRWERGYDYNLGSGTLRRSSLSDYPDLLSRYDDLNPTNIEVSFDVKFSVAGTGKSTINAFSKYDGIRESYFNPSGQVVIKKVTDNFLIGKSGEMMRDFSPSSPRDWQSFMEWPQSSIANNLSNKEQAAKNTFRLAQSMQVSNLRITNIDLPDASAQAIFDEYQRLEKEKKKEKEEDVEDDTQTNDEDDDLWGNSNENDIEEDLWGDSSDKRTNEDLDDDLWDSQAYVNDLFAEAIQLTAPTKDTSSDKAVYWIEGGVDFNKLGDASVISKLRKEARFELYVNQQRQSVTLRPDGSFRTAAVLGAGSNRIKFIGNINGQSAEIVRNIFYTGERNRLRVTLTWEGRADIDLHVTNPTGVRVSFQNKNAGGMKLDVDNTKADGPENVSVPDTLPGEYIIEAVNFKSNGGINARVYVFVDEVLEDEYSYTFKSGRRKENWSVTKVEMN